MLVPAMVPPGRTLLDRRFLMMQALEIMAKHLSSHTQARPQRLFAIANSRFLEVHQNALAAASCQQFALDTHMVWLGSLVVGAGTVVPKSPLSRV